MRANTPRLRSEPLRLLWELFGLSDTARTVCVLFGDRMPRQRRRKRRFRAGGRSRRFHSCRTSKRIRHHPECGWNQTQTDRGATVTGAGDAGDYAGERGSRSSVAGRSVGATESADPVFHPSNVEARRFQSPVNSEWFMRGPVGRGQKGGDRLATSSRRQSETEADCLTRHHLSLPGDRGFESLPLRHTIFLTN